MDMYIKQFAEAIEELNKFEALADEAGERMVENPLDAEIEHVFDAYYSKEFHYWMESVKLLKILIKCDDNTAKKMIATKRNEITNLVARMA